MEAGQDVVPWGIPLVLDDSGEGQCPGDPHVRFIKVIAPHQHLGLVKGAIAVGPLAVEQPDTAGLRI